MLYWLYLQLYLAQMFKNLPAVCETQVWSLGWEDPWRREWQPTPVFLPGESHGQRSLVGYSPWSHKESDTTEWLTLSLFTTFPTHQEESWIEIKSDYFWLYPSTKSNAAASLQSCPTLCDPIDGSPPGSPVPGILQARTLEWVAVSFSSAWKWKVKVKLLSRVWLLATPWTAAYQAPPSMGFSRQQYWSGVPLPSPKSPMCSHLTGTHIVGCMSNRLLARSHILYVSLPHVLLRLNLSNKSFKRIYVEKVLKPQEK